MRYTGWGGALLACISAAVPVGFAAPTATPGQAEPPVPYALDGGFTRETTMDLYSYAPEPKPLAASSEVAVDTSAARSTVRHYRRSPRHLRSEKKPSEIVVRGSSKRRNPVESFVYHWNGWVIRTFHTKVGTVMLSRIGAKS